MNTINKAPKRVEKKTKKASSPTSKNRDHFHLLITDANFQKEIRKIREKLGIPPDGFTEQSKVQDWDNKKCDEIDKIFDSKEFSDRIRKISKDFQDQKITSREKNYLTYEAHLVLPTNYEVHAVKEIIKNFNLPENYEPMLRAYLINNSIFFLPNNFSISYSKDRGGISINVYTRLTDEDLREIKKFVNTIHKDRLPHMQSLNGMDTKLAVERASHRGYETDVITGKKYKINNEEIAEEFFGDTSRANDVYETKRGLERLRKSRFTPRKTIGQ